MKGYFGFIILAGLLGFSASFALTPSHAKWAKDHPPLTAKVVYTSTPLAKKC